MSDTGWAQIRAANIPVVENKNGIFTAYFGYNIPNLFGLPVPIGLANTFESAPVDRSQPVAFLPFQRPRRVAVDFAKSSVAWQLGGQSATATASTTPCG